NEGRRQSRECTIGEILIAERDEGEHAKPDGERDRNSGRDEAADGVLTQVRYPGSGHGMGKGEETLQRARFTNMPCCDRLYEVSGEPAVRRAMLVWAYRNLRNVLLAVVDESAADVSPICS